MKLWLRCSIVLMACVAQGVRAESAETAIPIGSQTRLSQWLLGMSDSQIKSPKLSSYSNSSTLYFPGLVWMVPEEIAAQSRLKKQLLERITATNFSSGASRDYAAKLASYVESLPITGRVVVEKTDPRWMEVNPTHDPVLHQGQSILIPSRPSSVTVVWGDGGTCQVTHSVNAFAMNYVRKCQASRNASREPDTVWIVQPDGLVQRRSVANWNEIEQDPPAPGAWIVADDSITPWSPLILEQLARLLATQGVANDKITLPISPLSSNPKEFAFEPVHPPSALQAAGSLMQTPTARMGKAGEFSMNVHHVWPYTDLNADVQPFDWFEVNFGYSDFANQLYGPASFSGSQTYKDKSLDLKFKLSDESANLPQVVIGGQDVLGTALRAGEYVVASKRTGSLDWSLGLGWGYLGARGNLRNPLSVFGSSLNTRQAKNSGTTGGNFNVSSLFTGRTSLFGGVQYQTPWDQLLLKLELDGNNYQHEPFGNNLKQTSPINVGVVYRYSPAIDLSMSWERGTTLGLGISLHTDLAQLGMPKISDPQSEKVSRVYPTEEPDWRKVAEDLEEKTHWRVLQINRSGSELIVRFDRTDAVYWNSYMDRIVSVLHRAVPNRGTMVFRIQSADFGLGIHEYLVDRQAWVDSKTLFIPPHRVASTVFEQPESKGFVYPVSNSLLERDRNQFDGVTGLTFDHAFGGPEGFLYNIGVSTKGNWYVQPDTWWTAGLAHKVVDNYNNFVYPASLSTLPRVRTHIESYYSTNAVTIPVFQLTHVGKLDKENFYSVYGGLLEMMYAGVGAEWLYRPWKSKVAFGVDVNEVRQRGFQQDFSLLNPKYQATTGHASVYWEGINDLNVTLRIGRYLAGDIGATLDVSRVFENGVKVGAFATKTNVSAAQFGEGSFDKGIHVDVPFDAFLIRSSTNIATLNYHPLTRDGGAMLNREFQLSNLTHKQSGDLLKWKASESNRTTQFGDVPDSFPETTDYSVFSAAKNDLKAFGHAATTPDFWHSMMVIGGVSLASAIADKPLDKFAVKHGSAPFMKRVETMGNDLPFIALGYSGMLFLTNDQDSRLGRVSYSSLAAGGVGFLGTMGLKYVVGRSRPNLGFGSASFTPVNINNSNASWPSGHTTIMWAAITPYAKAYDAPWLYGLAALTNVARIGGRNHFLSDTVAGSLFGYAIGDFMWESHKTKSHGSQWVVTPNGVTAYWKIE